MKKKIIILSITCLLTIFIGIFAYLLFTGHLEKTRIEIQLRENMTMEFLEEKKVSDFIESMNGTIIDDYEIDSTVVGEQKITFEYINDQNRKVEYSYIIEVQDVTPPTIMLDSSYRVKVGSSENFIQNIFCGDDYDRNPTCIIEGDYDLNVVGTYPVTFKATDKSGNSTSKNIHLIVYEPQPSNGSSSNNTTKTNFEDVVKEYKTASTKIGLDISKWQGMIDFDALKESGVEFVIIRVGGTRGTNGEYFVDSQFVNNIENASRVGIDVGVYFYSYADSRDSAKEDAKWLLQQIEGYDIQLPIAFDWEEWSSFNEFHLSFYELTQIADTFLNTVEEAGYQGMLYSSKVYLEKIWMQQDHDIWLAHYTTQTDYEGKYLFWQLCNNGKVNGITGDVDIDILYLNEKS